ARQQIAAAARAGVNHDFDRPAGLESLRERRAGERDSQRDERNQESNFRRHALTLEKTGMSRISSANDSITAEIGLATRIVRLPSDIISDWRSARSIAPP